MVPGAACDGDGERYRRSATTRAPVFTLCNDESAHKSRTGHSLARESEAQSSVAVCDRRNVTVGTNDTADPAKVLAAIPDSGSSQNAMASAMLGLRIKGASVR